MTSYEIKDTLQFRRLLAKLPTDVRSRARAAYQRFRQDPRHPSLHFKRVHPLKPAYSVRIGRKYRAIGMVDGQEIVWDWIGIHADYDEVLKHL